MYQAVKDHISNHHQTPLDLARELAKNATYYENIVEARDSDQNVERLLGDISALSAKALLPAVLSGFAVWESAKNRPAKLSKLLEALITAFVRHNVIGGLESTALETQIYSVATTLRQNQNIGAATGRLKKFSPDDLAFKSEISEASVARAASARYVLKKLELHSRTGEMTINSSKWANLEHIYPRNPENSDRWDEHEDWINRLGNLTLMSTKLNSASKNKPFLDKRDAYYKNSEIKMTSNLATIKDWNSKAIAIRQSKMSKVANKVWPL